MKLTFEVTLTYTEDNEPRLGEEVPEPGDLLDWIIEGAQLTNCREPDIKVDAVRR